MKDSLASRVRASLPVDLHGEARSRHQPLVTPLADKVIIVQIWIGRVDPFNFRTLTAAECLVRIQAPDCFQQSLPNTIF